MWDEDLSVFFWNNKWPPVTALVNMISESEWNLKVKDFRRVWKLSKMKIKAGYLQWIISFDIAPILYFQKINTFSPMKYFQKCHEAPWNFRKFLSYKSALCNISQLPMIKIYFGIKCEKDICGLLNNMLVRMGFWPLSLKFPFKFLF